MPPAPRRRRAVEKDVEKDNVFHELANREWDVLK
jgi:hypothetical protein